MKKLIQEIRQQPLYVRHFFMWSLVVITFSLIGFAWFQETKSDFVALLSESSGNIPQEEGRAFAQATPEPDSPFASLRNSISDLGANISKLISGDASPATQDNSTIFSSVPPQRLP